MCNQGNQNTSVIDRLTKLGAVVHRYKHKETDPFRYSLCFTKLDDEIHNLGVDISLTDRTLILVDTLSYNETVKYNKLGAFGVEYSLSESDVEVLGRILGIDSTIFYWNMEIKGHSDDLINELMR